MNNGSNRKNGNVRESFNSQWGFILACIGSAVGMEIYGCFPQGFRFMAVEHF